MPPTAAASSPDSTRIMGLTKRWAMPGPARPDLPGVHPVVGRILANRPWLRASDLTPRLTGLHDPSDIPDLDRTAQDLLGAARAGRTIAIYGDYDVDGTTGSAILYHVLRAVGPQARLVHVVPHRLHEGYGLHPQAVERLAEQGVELIVTVDCGITAHQAAAKARQLGVLLYVTDHHNPPDSLEALPPAEAVVHPGRPDSVYPFAGLCGAGVAFKLAWRISTLAGDGGRASAPLRSLLLGLLPLVALGTVADVCPLVDENRILVAHGLGLLRQSGNRGLEELVRRCIPDDRRPTAGDLGFRLGPRINAVGRLDHASKAFDLLTTDDPQRIESICQEMERLNARRQAVEQRIVEQACARAEQAGMHQPDHRAIVLADPQWHPGVIGIACSRLVERYHRPTVLLNQGQAACKGSGRSIPGYNLHRALACCAGELSHFGGHDAAVGLALPPERLEAFSDALVRHANHALTPDDLIATITIDAQASLHELDERAAAAIESLGPFGRGNPTPRILVAGLKACTAPRLMGAGLRHMSLLARDAGGRTIKLVGWQWARHAHRIRNGMALDVVLTPKVERYRGVRTVMGEIADLRPADHPPAHE
ncbi:MAG: single-stranded-DNA-specific exonuclease RecJ [Phycisphaerales bacterium]|nr:MAG: single-stranded-DNA-specific exonuclease RecJ [Phycisphaerales bacterium]